MTRLFLTRLSLYLAIGLIAVWMTVLDDSWTSRTSFWVGAYLASCVFVMLSHGDPR